MCRQSVGVICNHLKNVRGNYFDLLTDTLSASWWNRTTCQQMPTNQHQTHCWYPNRITSFMFIFSLPSSPPQAPSVCTGAVPSWMAGWRCTWEEHGAQSAATDGVMKTLLWPVDSWPGGQRAHTPIRVRTDLTLLLSAHIRRHKCYCHLQHQVPQRAD